MAPASVDGVVYFDFVGTDVAGLVTGPDRCHGGTSGGDMHLRRT